jgi:murein L,D-transpeptidase YafK
MGFRPFREKLRHAGTALRWGALALGLVGLGACQDSGIPKEMKPVPSRLVAKMDQLSMKATSPIFVRIYKESSEMEIWKQRTDGQYALLETYPICKWSGALGPKKAEGDRQAPEGFYTVTPAQMNPKSNYYLSFNIGYPNAYDRSLGRTGSNLMVHGACSSAGCYSMTDEEAGEIFALARDSFLGGQRAFQIQALPFRMTVDNLAKHSDDPNMPFWKMLKVGADSFDLTRRPPKVDVCEKRYVFNADAGGASFDASGPCPAISYPEPLASTLASKEAGDDQAIAAKVAALKADAAKAAEAAQAAADKQAAAEQRAAERAQQPSLISRLLGRDKAEEAAPAAAPAESAAPVVQASAQTQSKPTAVATVPPPRLRPGDGAVSGETTASVTAETAVPAGATLVKKKLPWWGEETADAPTQ